MTINRENISVSFTPHQAAFLASCVASGRYQSTSEAVREAIRLLQNQHEEREAKLERIQNLIEEGAQQLDRGQVVDLETFMSDGRKELKEITAKHRRQKKAE